MTRSSLSKIATTLVCLAAAGVLLVGVRRALAAGDVQGRLSRVMLNGLVASEPPSAAVPLKPGTRHRELVAVLIATSECVGTRNPDFVPAVREMKAELARRAAVQGSRLRLIGVALDDRVGDGLALLDRVGPFHEVSVGGNWLNSNAVSHIWRSRQRTTDVPQWVILEREVATGPSSITVAPDSVIAIVAGADKMRRWVRTSRMQLPSVTPRPRRASR